jgi:tRNA/rRNA methyltransferase
VTIPGEAGACLNLAQAALILAYEWRKAGAPAGRAPTAVAAEAGIADLAGVLGERLDALGLLKPGERTSKLHTLRRILSRASLTPDEAALVAGWLHAWRRAADGG